jgi:type II secretory ATPase GspE/PulE/Tfp pilus assembly ATPase PilB-like protein
MEFRLPGASQTIASPRHGITVHNGLQAALNQDPNVVMLSTLPDRLTITSAVQAAVGGHLILAGMHADNAAKGAVQLQTMNEENFLFANALKIVISQRLIRRLCPQCRIFYTPDQNELKGVEKTFGITTAAARLQVHQLEHEAIREGIGDDSSVTTQKGLHSLWRASDDGCIACHHTGYQGSLAVTEVLSAFDNETADALLSPVLPAKLHKTALKDGFVPMELDGLIKALRGQTTLTELLRVLSA